MGKGREIKKMNEIEFQKDCECPICDSCDITEVCKLDKRVLYRCEICFTEWSEEIDDE